MIRTDGVYPEGKVTFAFHDIPMKITGLQKVVQTFLKILLTAKGSDPFYPQRGSEFPDLVVNANLLTDDATLLSDITSAIRDATIQTRSSLNINTADLSSTLDNVEVLGLDRIDEGVVIYLKAITLAGEFAAVAVPFPEFGLGTWVKT